jgi:NAD(P)-dependent dehydrogenase (short-subunit alcohol dehydrogenase family)
MSRKGFTQSDVPDQSGRCFVVTGANTGIGFETSRVLASRGARVLLACRDQSKAEAAILRITQESPKADVEFLPLNLADLNSVRRAADLAAEEARIDVLVNNAGVLMPPLTHTKQGFELQFGVNYLGTFALTALLLPRLSETPAARVVVTSSGAQNGAKIDWDDLDARDSYTRYQRYAASKLAIALFLSELDRRLRAAERGITAVGCHPGAAATDIGRHVRLFQILIPLVRLLFNDAAMGAWPTLQASTGPVRPGGYYGPIGFGGLRGPSGEVSLDPSAEDSALARRLWELSIDLTGCDPRI